MRHPDVAALVGRGQAAAPLHAALVPPRSVAASGVGVGVDTTVQAPEHCKQAPPLVSLSCREDPDGRGSRASTETRESSRAGPEACTFKVTGCRGIQRRAENRPKIGDRQSPRSNLALPLHTRKVPGSPCYTSHFTAAFSITKRS